MFLLFLLLFDLLSCFPFHLLFCVVKPNAVVGLALQSRGGMDPEVQKPVIRFMRFYLLIVFQHSLLLSTMIVLT